MSYQEKRTGAYIFSCLLVLAAYCIYAFNPARLATLTPGDLKPWAITILVFIGIEVVAAIVIQIVFHILLSISLAVQLKIENQQVDDEQIGQSVKRTIQFDMVEDERDRQVESKSHRIGLIFAGFGFITALLAVVFNYSPVVMLNILFISFSAGSILETSVQFYYYRKGV